MNELHSQITDMLCARACIRKHWRCCRRSTVANEMAITTLTAKRCYASARAHDNCARARARVSFSHMRAHARDKAALRLALIYMDDMDDNGALDSKVVVAIDNDDARAH